MNSEYWQKVERVLDLALESEPSTWPELVERECSGDDALRREVESLLGRYSSAHAFLRVRPAATAAALLAESRQEAEGSSFEGRRFGAYRVIHELGRGGMSRVFLAERADGAFEQQVALKLLRPGLDSDIDLDRFKVERQVLASLNHPNIARLLDGGVGSDGVSFLVLELVDGEPIDRYCDSRHCDVRRRLELFLEMAGAVQMAHRCLVVHRDLKPSNIFVTRDGTVKLLDFGLAKLLEPHAPSEAPSRTLTGQRWMTPEYAAPEQILGQPITTSTDVYQLGAVLHRLVSGRPPFGERTNSVHELERHVLEGELAPMTGELRGDLEAILRKALAKDPGARYASVQEFADDIRRYLMRRPVLARGQSAAYRARRFVRRHRIGVATAAAGLALFSVYVGTVLVDRERVRRALVEAQAGTRKAEQVTDFMLGLFEAAEGGQSLHDTVTAELLLNRGVEHAHALTGQPELEAQMLDVIGRIRTQLGESEKAMPLLTEALSIRRSTYGEMHPEVATSLEALANAAGVRRSDTATIALRRRVLDIRRATVGADDPKTLDALYALATTIHSSGNPAAADSLYVAWLNELSHQPREVSERRAKQLNQAGLVFQSRRELDRADSAFQQALAMRISLYGERQTAVADVIGNIAFDADQRRDLRASDSLHGKEIRILRGLYPDGHPALAIALKLYANSLQRSDRFADAEPLFRESRALVERFQGTDGIAMANADIDLGFTLAMLGKYQEAESYDREAIRIYRSMFDDKNAMVVMARDHLGDALRGEGRFAEAETLLLAGYERFKVPNSVTRIWRGHVLLALVRLYEAEGRADEAAKYRAIVNAPPPAPQPALAGAPAERGGGGRP